MALPEFTIDLGNGTYLDSSGALKTTRDDGRASFKLPASLPIAGPELQKTFKAFETIIPNLNKLGVFDAGQLARFEGLGLSDDFIELLGKAANIAEKLASVIPVVNIVVGLANVLGLFGGSDPVKDLINQQFTKLFARMDEDERNRQKDYISKCTGVFDAALGLVDDYKNELDNLGYTPDSEIKAKLLLCEAKLSEYEDTLFDAAGGHVWMMPFNKDDYKWDRGFMTLYTMPDGGGPTFVGYPAVASPFDHRMMLPLLIYGVQTYLTLIKAIAPEHRTTGQFRTDLLRLADRLAGRLSQMRSEVLGRTFHRAGDPLSTGPGPLGFGQQILPMTVGAVDLRADTDVYFSSAEAAKAAATHPEPQRRGNVNFGWTPPPGVKFGDPWNDGYVLAAPAADAANQQAARDYSELLARGGFLTLAHLEALTRHLATEPDRSETVTGRAELWRKPLEGHDVPIVDDTIPFSPPITATGHREPQDCEGDVFLATQPARHSETIGYRVRLLTLPDGITPNAFDWYVWSDYTPVDPFDPGNRNWQLEINENSGLPIDPIDRATGKSKGLLKDSATPTDPIIEHNKTVTLTADTFDWYVPIPPLKVWPGIVRQVAADVGYAAAAGADAAPPPPPASGSDAGGRGTSVVIASEVVRRSAGGGISSFAGWEGGEQSWKGEKREFQRTQVEITYDLYWAAENPASPARLSLTLKSRPQDRNFVVYVVVEEYLKHSKQWLRTPVKVQFNGQLTYVPQSFFDEEAAARKRAGQIIGEIERHYSISRQPQPGDPVTGWIRPGTMDDPANMQRFVKLAEQYAPEVVRQAVAEVEKASEPRGQRAIAAT